MLDALDLEARLGGAIAVQPRPAPDRSDENTAHSMNSMLQIAALAALVLPISALCSAGEGPARKTEVSNKPIAAFRVDLVELAFRAATKLPSSPHAKTRSKLQDDVATTCFELDQPRRA